MSGNITKFLKFQQDQGGVLPPRLAHQYLGISRQALHVAKKEKKVSVQVVAGTTFYGMKSLRFYKELRTARSATNKAIKQCVTD